MLELSGRVTLLEFDADYCVCIRYQTIMIAILIARQRLQAVTYSLFIEN